MSPVLFYITAVILEDYFRERVHHLLDEERITKTATQGGASPFVHDANEPADRNADILKTTQFIKPGEEDDIEKMDIKDQIQF
jgi:hypothetical protein